MTAPKRSKYGNRKVSYQGAVFDSNGELQRFLILKDYEKRKLISNLKRQVPVELLSCGMKVGKLIMDYTYELNGKTVYSDFKGMETPTFRLKHKIFIANHGEPIKIITRANLTSPP